MCMWFGRVNKKNPWPIYLKQKKEEIEEEFVLGKSKKCWNVLVLVPKIPYNKNAAVSNVCLFYICHPNVVSQLIIFKGRGKGNNRNKTGSSDVLNWCETERCHVVLRYRNKSHFQKNGTKYNYKCEHERVKFAWMPCKLECKRFVKMILNLWIDEYV